MNDREKLEAERDLLIERLAIVQESLDAVNKALEAIK